MKQKILNFIKKNNYVKEYQIYSTFHDSKKTISLCLQQLLNEGYLIKDEDNYIVPSALGLLLGEVVSIKNEYAFIRLLETEEEFYVREEELNGALLNDRVYVRVHQYGIKVVKIVVRYYKEIIGEVFLDNKKWFISCPTYAPKGYKFRLYEYEGKEGDIVSFTIEENKGMNFKVNVTKILGSKNAPHMDVTRVILEHGAPLEFDEEVNKELLNIPLEVKEEELNGRVDLREELIVTIDGEDARDLDDAVSVKKTKNGYSVGVHIADVSYYVKEGSKIDKSALKRGTSIYVTDRVVPMLPFLLSNGICSLNENVDRLTISCFMEFDEEGKMISSKIVPSIIKSKHRLTYNYVNKVILSNNDEGELNKLILLLHEVASKIRKVREDRGSLDLDVPEIKIKVDEDGKPIDIIKRVQGAGERLIEDLMVAANEAVATTIFKRKLPFIYRIHEQPTAKKMDGFIAFAQKIGYPVSFNPLTVKPLELSLYLARIKRQEDKEIISKVMLRSLAKARYHEDNRGHFGLASSCYTHFTSPIRRYPDLIVHRLLRKYIFNDDFSNIKELTELLIYLAEDTSIKERRAITIEREVVDLKGAEYMQNHLGEEFEGYIDGMSNKGLFVELDNGLSGLITFESLNDFFRLDTYSQTAFARHKGTRFVLGEKVKVMVVEASKGNRTITLELLDSRMHKSRHQIKKTFKRK